MKTHRSFLALGILLGLLASLLIAQTRPTQTPQPVRFTMQQTPGGLVVLDMTTGIIKGVGDGRSAPSVRYEYGQSFNP